MSEQTGHTRTTAELEAHIWNALADAGEAVEAMPPDQRNSAVNDAFDGLFPSQQSQRDFLIGVVVVLHARRLADKARRKAEAQVVQ